MLVHATRPIGEDVVKSRFSHPAGPDVAIYVDSSAATSDVAAALVESVLGVAARRHLRSSDRVFPLRSGGLYYSVSRTSAVTMLAVSTQPIGIDIERQLDIDVLPDLAWALTPSERSEVAGGCAATLTEIWTAKEAAGKALGVGLQSAPAGIETTLHPSKPLHRAARVSVRGTVITASTYGWRSGEHYIRLAWR